MIDKVSSQPKPNPPLKKSTLWADFDSHTVHRSLKWKVCDPNKRLLLQQTPAKYPQGNQDSPKSRISSRGPRGGLGEAIIIASLLRVLQELSICSVVAHPGQKKEAVLLAIISGWVWDLP
jgi:hypothetical protein